MKASSVFVALLAAASTLGSPLLDTRNTDGKNNELVVDLGDAGKFKGTFVANGTVKTWRGTSLYQPMLVGRGPDRGRA